MSGASEVHEKLFRLYEHYVGEPDSPKDVYGYWLFIVGYVIGAAGVFTFVVGYAGETDSTGLIRVSGVTAATGLSLCLFGIVLMLPVRRRGIQASAVGLVVALVGVASFGVVYPSDWRGFGADYSVEVIAIYAAGIGIIAGVTALVPVVTGRKGMFVTEEGVTEDPPILVGEALEGAQFAVFRDENGDWVWHALHLEALAGSEGSSPTRPAAESSIDRFRSKIGDAGLLELTTAAFRLYADEDGRWHWLLMREDGSILAESPDPLDARDDVEETVSFLKDRGPDADVIEIDDAAFNYVEERGRWHWRLLDADRTVLATDPSGRESQPAAEDAALAFADRFEDARLLAIDHVGVELRERADDWGWRIVDADDEPVAESTVGYDGRRDAEEATEAILPALESAAVTVAGEPAFENYEVGEGWRWRLVDAGGSVVARSPASSPSADASESEHAAFAANAAEADVVEIEGAEYELYPDGEGESWHWRLVTEDREVIADSTEPHEDPAAAEAAIERVRAQASEAELIEFEESAFQVYEAEGGEWRWRLIDEDGTVLADSGQEHESKDEAARTMTTLKEQAPDAEMLEIETAAFELFRDEDERWGWRLIDEGGRMVAEEPTTHPDRGSAKAAMDRLLDRLDADVRTMERAIFQTYSAADWEWRFVLPTNEVVAASEEGYATRDELAERLEGIRETATGAVSHRIGDVFVQLYGDGEWRFRLLERDRSTVADSTRSYDDREGAAAAVERLADRAADAPIFAIEDAAIRLDDDVGWELIERDRTVLATAGEGDRSREETVAEVDRIRRLAPAAGEVDFDIASYELFEDGEWGWRLIDENGRTVAAGAERFGSEGTVRERLGEVRESIGDASILEIEGASFELHAAEDDGWLWRLVDEHGRPMAESTRSYASRTDAREAMNAVKRHAPEGWITFTE